MPVRQGRVARGARNGFAGLAAALALAGCVANSSNPRVTIRSAACGQERATFELDLINPGGRNLRVTRLDYAVSHGESSFPVASGTWTGEADLPARGKASLSLETRFGATPIEPESNLLHLSGELYFVDKTGYLGLRMMDLTRTSFQAEVNATREKP